MSRHLTAKDAVFISPHKFPGGPGTPGLLVIKKALMRNNTPRSEPNNAPSSSLYAAKVWRLFLLCVQPGQHGVCCRSEK